MKLIRILLLLLPAYTYGQTPEHEDWKTIAQSNYSLQYPADWELNESGQLGTTLILFSPLESADDTFRENINLIVQDLTGYNLDLDKYAKISEEQVKTMITNSKIVESKKIPSNPNPYHKIIYTGTQGVFDLKFEQYYFIVDNKAYILTFTAERDNFGKFKKTGEEILNSFIIK